MDDPAFIKKWQDMKAEVKGIAMNFIEEKTGVKVPRNAMLDMQASFRMCSNLLSWCTNLHLQFIFLQHF